MITYNRSAFGWKLIFRIHGSAVYRSVIPSLVAVGILSAIRHLHAHRVIFYGGDMGEDLGHPYAIGVLVASTTFLIVFRANQGYNRYWEAASATHHMMSKWMDATIHTGVYHLQCDHYDAIKPPSYYDYPQLNALNLTRDRERGYEPDEDSEHVILDRTPLGSTHRKQLMKEKVRQVSMRSVTKSINYVEDKKKRESAAKNMKASNEMVTSAKFADIPMSEQAPLLGRGRLDGNWSKLFDDGKATFYNLDNPDRRDPKGFAGDHGGRTPPLFLQELAHLASLLVAVAFATLRSDVDEAEAPLAVYQAGSPWPEVDPNKDDAVKSYSFRGFVRRCKFFTGFAPTPEERRRYNAARPLPVIGGVSDNEIQFLQMARGPYAKTQLCWNWLSEFCIREHLAGSTGKVGPPIISRVIQFLGDGMIYYNHARKIRFIPFPFVHAQLSCLFVVVMVPAIPFLMDQYTSNIWLGSILTFFTVMCLSGIHEVARELENPFQNVPNELPLVTFQAHFNEALITMYSGYHPDHYWDGDRALRKRGRMAGSPTFSETPESSNVSQPSSDPMESQQPPPSPPPSKEPSEEPSPPPSEEPTETQSPKNGMINGEHSTNDAEEIQKLKQQLEAQQKLIEQLAAKINMDPVEETVRLETALDEIENSPSS